MGAHPRKTTTTVSLPSYSLIFNTGVYFTSTQEYTPLNFKTAQFADIADLNYEKFSSTLNCLYPGLKNFTIVAKDDTIKLDSFDPIIKTLSKNKFHPLGNLHSSMKEIALSSFRNLIESFFL